MDVDEEFSSPLPPSAEMDDLTRDHANDGQQSGIIKTNGDKELSRAADDADLSSQSASLKTTEMRHNNNKLAQLNGHLSDYGGLKQHEPAADAAQLGEGKQFTDDANAAEIAYSSDHQKSTDAERNKYRSGGFRPPALYTRNSIGGTTTTTALERAAVDDNQADHHQHHTTQVVSKASGAVCFQCSSSRHTVDGHPSSFASTLAKVSMLNQLSTSGEDSGLGGGGVGSHEMAEIMHNYVRALHSSPAFQTFIQSRSAATTSTVVAAAPSPGSAMMVNDDLPAGAGSNSRSQSLSHDGGNSNAGHNNNSSYMKALSPRFLHESGLCYHLFNQWSENEQVLYVQFLLDQMQHSSQSRVNVYLKPKLQRDFISLLPKIGMQHIAEAILEKLNDHDLRACEKVSPEWYRAIADGMQWKKLIERHVMHDSMWRGLGERRGWMRHLFKRLATQFPAQVAPVLSNDYFRALYPDILKDIRRLEDNWRSGKHILQRINCRSENSKGVYCLQYDEDKIVSGLRDNTIKIWDKKTLHLRNTLKGHNGSVLCLQYDDRIIISGSSDATVRVWDVNTGEQLAHLLHHCEAVLHLRFGYGIMVTCSKDRSIAVWDMASSRDINFRRNLVGHRAAVNVVDFDEKYIVSASGDRSIKVWNTQTCELVRNLGGHRRGIACLQYRDKLVVSGSSDYTIRIWDIELGHCLRVLEGHEELVRCIRFDNKRIVSGAYDGKIKVWDLEAALDVRRSAASLCIQTLVEHTGRVFRLQFDEFQIVSSSHDDTILIWDFFNVRSAAAAGGTQQHGSGGGGGGGGIPPPPPAPPGGGGGGGDGTGGGGNLQHYPQFFHQHSSGGAGGGFPPSGTAGGAGGSGNVSDCSHVATVDGAAGGVDADLIWDAATQQLSNSIVASVLEQQQQQSSRQPSHRQRQLANGPLNPGFTGPLNLGMHGLSWVPQPQQLAAGISNSGDAASSAMHFALPIQRMPTAQPHNHHHHQHGGGAAAGHSSRRQKQSSKAHSSRSVSDVADIERLADAGVDADGKTMENIQPQLSQLELNAAVAAASAAVIQQNQQLLAAELQLQHQHHSRSGSSRPATVAVGRGAPSAAAVAAAGQRQLQYTTGHVSSPALFDSAKNSFDACEQQQQQPSANNVNGSSPPSVINSGRTNDLAARRQRARNNIGGSNDNDSSNTSSSDGGTPAHHQPAYLSGVGHGNSPPDRLEFACEQRFIMGGAGHGSGGVAVELSPTSGGQSSSSAVYVRHKAKRSIADLSGAAAAAAASRRSTTTGNNTNNNILQQLPTTLHRMGSPIAFPVSLVVGVQEAAVPTSEAPSSSSFAAAVLNTASSSNDDAVENKQSPTVNSSGAPSPTATDADDAGEELERQAV